MEVVCFQKIASLFSFSMLPRAGSIIHKYYKIRCQTTPDNILDASLINYFYLFVTMSLLMKCLLSPLLNTWKLVGMVYFLDII